MDELRNLEQLLDELLKGIQDALQSGEVLSDEFQLLLAQELTATTDWIDRLRAGEQGQEQLQQLDPSLPPLPEIEAEQAQIANEITPPEEPTPQAPSEPIPPLDDAPYESSNISGFKYDPKSQKLIIRFQGKYPQKNSGSIYSYEGVPQNIFNVFRRGAVAPRTSGQNAWHRWHRNQAPSLGASAYALIREGGYKYRKLR